MASLTLKSILFKKYLILKKIDEGSFGSIYLSKNIKTNEKVAIKIENRKIENPLLEREAYILFYLRGPGLPQVKTFGKTKDLFVLIQNLLGPSLANLSEKYSINFTIKDICMLSIQMLERLEYIHSKNYIHRDIKPHNFLMGIDDPDILYLIDFGLAKKYKSKKGNHIKFSINNNITGTPRYCSINGLRGAEQSRRDDLESLFYVIMYFFRGNLPWQNLKIKSREERFNKINSIKKNINYKVLCENLPKELYNFGIYIKHLKFEEDPDYTFMQKCFYSILKKINEKNDNKFSWLKKFNSYSKIKKSTKSQQNTVKRRHSSHKRLLDKISSSLEKKMRKKSDNSLNKVQINIINNNNKDNITLKSFNIEKNNNGNIKKTNSYVANEINHINNLTKKKLSILYENKTKNDLLKYINRNKTNLNIRKNKTQFYGNNISSNFLFTDESNTNEMINFNSNNNEIIKNIFTDINNNISYNSSKFINALKRKENSMKNLKINFVNKDNYFKLLERNKKIKQILIPNNITGKSLQNNKKLNLQNNFSINNIKIINKSMNNSKKSNLITKSLKKTNLSIEKNKNYINNNNQNFRSFTNILTDINEIKSNNIKRINTDTSLKLNKNIIYHRLNLNIKYNPINLRKINNIKQNKINNQNINLNIKLINNNNYNNILLKNSKDKIKINIKKNPNKNIDIINNNNLNRVAKYKTHRKAFTNYNISDFNFNEVNKVMGKKINNKVNIIDIPLNKKYFNNKFLYYHSNINKK